MRLTVRHLALFEKESDFFHPARYRGSISGSVYGRSSAVFIESEELYCNAEKRLESVIARLEENGNEVHVIRAGHGTSSSD